MTNWRVPVRVGGCAWVGTLLLLACGRPDNTPERGVGAIADSALVARVLGLNAPPGPWRTVTTPHFRLHVRAGSASARRVATLGDSAEAARRTVLRRFAINDAASVDLVFADTRAEMTRMIGRPTSGMVPRGERAAFLLAGATYRPLFRHELTHVYTLEAWGEPGPRGVWLSEGLATLATGNCTEVSVDARAADLARRGALVSVAELVRDFATFPEPVAYGEAASVLGFVLGTDSGLETIRVLWQSAAAAGRGPPRLPAAHPLGAEGVQLERAWRRSLEHVAPRAIDALAILRNGC